MQMHFSAPKKEQKTNAFPFFPLKNSLRRKHLSQADIDASMQHVEKGMRGLSFTSGASVTTPNFISVSKKMLNTCWLN